MWNYKILQDGKCAIGYSGRFDGVVSSEELAVAVCSAFNKLSVNKLEECDKNLNYFSRSITMKQ